MDGEHRDLRRGGTEAVRLQDLIDVGRLRQLLDSFALLSGGFVTAILDVDENVLTSSGWQDVCVQYHRASPETAVRCRRSDAYIRHHLSKQGKPVRYRCENGLLDVACAIVVDGRHVGSVFTGQFFEAPPDLEWFRRQARRFGFDEDAYLDAVRNAPVLAPAEVEERETFVRRLAEILGEMGLDRLQALRSRASQEEREDLLRAVIDNAPFGAHMYSLEDDGRLVFIGYNRKAEEMLGLDHRQFLGHTLEEAFPGNVGTGTPDAYRRVARDGGVFDLDQYVYDAGDIAGAFEVHAFNFGPRQVSVFFRDVTEKRRAEVDLHEAQTMLDIAQSAAHAGFWSWDVPTGVLTWSPPFFELFGLSGDAEASFETWRATLHPDDLEAAEARIMDSMQRRVPLENEYRVILPDGTVRWIGAWGMTSYDEAGEPLRMAGICLDIDDRKRREEEIRALNEELEARVEERTRELTEANRELQDFVYAVSHDLRSPLRALDGFSEVLLEDYAAVLDEAGQDSLHRIRSAAQHLAELIDALLGLSRVGRRDALLTDVDVSAEAAAILARLAEQDRERAVEVAVEPGLRAVSDAALVGIVLENLLGNAWKFTAEAAPALIEVKGAAWDGEGVFMVRDNGVGFDGSRAEEVFRPFSRMHGASQFPGTGIGLATVRRALAVMGGRCWAESAPGEGATFFFALGPS
jgi:PAS domain S-box-containing protein